MSKFKIFAWLVMLLVSPMGFAQTPDLCSIEDTALNDSASVLVDITDALAREDRTIQLTYIASSEVKEGDVQKAKRRALSIAFRHLVGLTIKEMVSAERYEEVHGIIKSKFLRHPRVYIRSFRSRVARNCEQGYRVDLNVKIKADVLRKDLLKHKVLNVIFVPKEVRLLNVRRAVDYEWIKKQLKKRIRNLNRVVEKFQRSGEVHFLVETSSTLDEMIVRLDPMILKTKTSPNFKIEKGEKGGLEITLL